jgi:V/A-type H+-transporting ATPase subunit G/H
LDALTTISEAEETARKDKAAAIQEARKMVADAEKAAQAALEDARRQGEEEAAAMMKKAEELASKETEALARTTENKKAVARAGVEKRLDQAADYIVGRIVNG